MSFVAARAISAVRRVLRRSRAIRRALGLTVGLAACGGLGTNARAQDAAPLRTVEQIRSAPAWQRWQRHPLHLAGVLTLLDRERKRIVIQDDTGAVALNFPTDGFAVPIGHRVVLDATDSTPYLDALPDFPLQPTGHEMLTTLEGPSDWGSNYVARVRGYLNPPTTGEYHFWISSDDSSQLWLGTDDRSDTAHLVAEVTSWTKPREWNYLPGQKSAPVSLVGGRRYYLEIVHEQRNGTDHLSVSWDGPGLPQQIVAGQYLSPPDDAPSGALPPTAVAARPRGSVLREYWRDRTVTDAALLSAPRKFEGTLTLAGPTLRDAGPGPLPRPHAISPSTPWHAADDYTWSEIEGTVDFAARRGDSVLVELTDGTANMRAVLMNARDIPAQRLNGRRLHLQGVAEPAYDTMGNRILGTLWVPEAAPSAVLNEWPFAERYPLTTIADLLAKDPAANSGGPVRVRGRVVATGRDGTITIADRGAFYGYVSTDGGNWRQVGQPVELDFDASVEAGVVVTSRSTETLATAVFDRVSGFPEPLQGTDMGGPTHPGRFQRNGDKLTVTGGGHDVWAKPDQCYFVHGRMTGAGTMIARVARFDATEGWAKCGLMVRASLEADADFADVVQTVSQGCTLQWRNPDGPVMRSSARDQTLVPPQWLKLERRFNTLTVRPTKTEQTAAGGLVEAMGYVGAEAGRAVLVDASLHPMPERARPRAPLIVEPIYWQIAQLRDASGNVDIRQVSKLRGVVTFFGPFRGESYLSMQDDSGAAFVMPRNIPAMPHLHPGQIVEIQCMPTTDSDSTVLYPDRIAVVGPGVLPTAVRPPMHNVLPRHGDGTWLEIGGVARAVSADGALEIKANGELFTVAVQGATVDQLRPFVDATLTVRGVYLHRTDPERVLLVPSMEQISAAPPATTSAFDAPLRRWADLVPARLRHESAHRIVVTATVTYVDRTFAYAEDESGAARIEFDGSATPHLDDTIVAAGFPDAAPDDSVVLTHALFRAAPAAKPIEPAPATLATFRNRGFSGRLVRVKAVFSGAEAVSGDNNTFEFQTEQRVFHATLPRPDDTLNSLPHGSVVEVTGVCVFENAPTDWIGGAAKATVLPVRLLLRSTADVVVLQKPRWWVVKRTLLVASVGALILFLSAIWIHVLRRRVAQRTAELDATMEKLKQETQNAATLAERNRLASEIHDSLEQGFSGLILQLDTTAKLGSCPPEVRSGLALARNMVAFSRNEVRHAVWDLHSPALEHGDLSTALRTIVAQIAPDTLQTNVTVEGPVRRLSSALEHHVLRIAQEAITNGVKHAQARHLEVTLTFGSADLRVVVRDDGQGFVPDRVMTGGVGHFGLRSLRGRAAKIGGVLTVSSAPAHGTTVELRVPILPPPKTI